MPKSYLAVTARLLRPAAYERIIIAEVRNPEAVLAEALKSYFNDVGFASQYSNFGNIHISAVHPFAMLLLQETLGQQYDMSLFPSITISDSSDTESMPLLDKDTETIELTEDLVQSLNVYIQRGELLASTDAVSRLLAALQSGTEILAKKGTVYIDHQVDFNIWAANKDITSILYDATRLFAVQNKNELRKSNVDVYAGSTGRRSGDINIDFGQLLFGANVNVPIRMRTSVMDIQIGSIPDQVVVQPTFYSTGER